MTTPRPRLSAAKSIDEIIAELQGKIRKLEKNGSTFKSYGFTRQTTLQSIPNAAVGSFTTLTFPAIGSGEATNGDITYTAGGISIGHAGDYLVSGYFALPLSAGTHQAVLLKNGVGINGTRSSGSTATAAGNGPAGIVIPTIIITCAVGDLIGLAGQQSSGVAQNTVVAGNEYSSITVLGLT